MQRTPIEKLSQLEIVKRGSRWTMVLHGRGDSGWEWRTDQTWQTKGELVRHIIEIQTQFAWSFRSSSNIVVFAHPKALDKHGWQVFDDHGNVLAMSWSFYKSRRDATSDLSTFEDAVMCE